MILGATVTVVASLSSAEFVFSNRLWDTTFAIAAPVLAAMLAIVGGGRNGQAAQGAQQ